MPFLTGARPIPRHKLAMMPPHRAGRMAASFNPTPQLSMWGNDQYGDCESAAQAFLKSCGGNFISDEEVIAWARARGWLNGADTLPVIEAMQQQGMTDAAGAQWGDGPSVQAVDFTSFAAMQAALAEGPLVTTVAAGQLQGVPGIGVKSGWIATEFSRDSSYDHEPAISAAGTFSQLAGLLGITLPPGVNPDTPGYLFFTWCTLGLIDVPSYANIAADATLILPTTVAQGTPTPTPPTPQPGPTRRAIALINRIADEYDQNPARVLSFLAGMESNFPPKPFSEIVR